MFAHLIEQTRLACESEPYWTPERKAQLKAKLAAKVGTSRRRPKRRKPCKGCGKPMLKLPAKTGEGETHVCTDCGPQ